MILIKDNIILVWTMFFDYGIYYIIMVNDAHNREYYSIMK